MSHPAKSMTSHTTADELAYRISPLLTCILTLPIFVWRSRNSTLRAVSLTSRKAFDLWYPPLIGSVTVYSTTLISLYRLLAGNRRELRRAIKSLRCTQSHLLETVLDEDTIVDTLLFSRSPISRSSVVDPKYFSEAVGHLSEVVISNLPNLSTLIIDDPTCVPSRMIALSFCSLKKLYLPLPRFTGLSTFTSARNVIWLLVFLSSLRDLAVGFTVSREDFDFLEEFKSTFEALSNVKKLALRAQFVFSQNDPESFWGMASEQKRKWVAGGNKKSTAIHNILLATKGLTSLEIISEESGSREGDSSRAHSSCVMSLSKSFQSLKHLRLLLHNDNQDPFSTDYAVFTNLKIFSLTFDSLHFFLKWETVAFPPSIEIIYVHSYLVAPELSMQNNATEEKDLATLLKSRSFPSLREVVVPTELVGFDGRLVGGSEVKVLWEQRRKDLEALEIFKGGKVKLIKEKPGPFSK